MRYLKKLKSLFKADEEKQIQKTKTLDLYSDKKTEDYCYPYMAEKIIQETKERDYCYLGKEFYVTKIHAFRNVKYLDEVNNAIFYFVHFGNKKCSARPIYSIDDLVFFLRKMDASFSGFDYLED